MRLYGTEMPPVATEELSVGALSFTLEDGALRHICVQGSEIIRGIAYLVRDRDWGTLTPALAVVSRESTANTVSLHLKAIFETATAKLEVSIRIEAATDSLSVKADGVATGAFETNRTGFTVLHSAGLSGCPVSVEHSRGPVEASVFPVLIDPWQPFMDITSITHRADGFAVRCAFEGDTFEMEDQRQWGDASYKTYVRPLALPWPYVLDQGEHFSQCVSVTWNKTGTPATAASKSVVSDGVTFPDTAILVSAADADRLAKHPEDIEAVAPRRLLCHVDTSACAVASQVAAFAKLQSTLKGPVYDLELICGFADPPAEELHKVRYSMDRAGFRPASVMVCPSVDRQSTPPGSDWPPCPSLEAVHQASAEAFGDIVRGGGMASFFPELNRKRPPSDMLDFVSHSLCPIVHAADDLSVMETLEAIPHIARSARAFIGTCDYRVGPCTIAMRQNPYGQRTLPNPDMTRVCMTHDDPRHRAQFGAAYVIGLACALAPCGITVWTPSELYGPRGLQGPLVKAISLLAGLAGGSVQEAAIKNGLAKLRIERTCLVANLTNRRRGGLGPYEFSASHAN